MWIFTTDGFFSAVQDNYCAPDEIMIRARKKADLTRMLDNLPGVSAKEILTIYTADYRHRIKLKKADWTTYVSDAANAIDYPNFKNATCKTDPPRSNAYHACWSALLNWQEKRPSNIF